MTFKTNQSLFTLGINLDGETIICKVIFVEYKKGSNSSDCVIYTSSNFKMKTESSTLFLTKDKALNSLNN